MTTQTIMAAATAAFIAVSANALDAEKIVGPKLLEEGRRLQMRNIEVRAAAGNPASSFAGQEPRDFEAVVRARNGREAAEEVFEGAPLRGAHNAPLAAIAYGIGFGLRPSRAEVAAYAAGAERDRAAVADAIDRLTTQETFAQAFHRAAERQSGRRFHVMRAAGETTDTVVENSVESIDLKPVRKDRYYLAMAVRTRVMARVTGEVIYDDVSSYESAAAGVSDWAFDGARPLKEQVTRACEQLSARIVRQVLPGGVSDRAERAEGEGLFVTRVNPLHPRHVAELGNVGVISTSAVSSITMQRPLTKTQAGREVHDELTEFVESTDDTIVFLAGSAASIPLSLAGKARGMWAGLTEKQFDRADRALVAAVSGAKLQPLLRKRFVEQANAVSAHPILEVAKPFPAGEEAEFSQFRSVMAGTLAWLPDGQTAEYYLQSQNVQTALEIEILNAALLGDGGVNPPMRFQAAVRATLWSVKDGLELASCELRHKSAARRFADWARNDAAALRRELGTFTEGASAAIVQQLGIPAWRVEQPLLARATAK